jgi:secreted PhoX family phosphatase
MKETLLLFAAFTANPEQQEKVKFEAFPITIVSQTPTHTPLLPVQTQQVVRPVASPGYGILPLQMSGMQVYPSSYEYRVIGANGVMMQCSNGQCSPVQSQPIAEGGYRPFRNWFRR